MGILGSLFKIATAPQQLAYRGWRDQPLVMGGLLAAATAPLWAPAVAPSAGAAAAAPAAPAAPSLGRQLAGQAGSALIQSAFQPPQNAPSSEFGLPRRPAPSSGGVHAYPGWQHPSASVADDPILRAYFGG
jgi:hypothetical protein